MSLQPGTAQWLILTMERAFGVFDMCMAVEAAGYTYKCASELPVDHDELIPDGACVVLNGPAARVAELAHIRHWIPNRWCEPNVFACETYYRYWSQQILQEQYEFFPFGSLADKQSYIYESIASGNRVFIRPDSFDKSFDGGLVDRKDFDSWLRRTRSPQIPDSTLCVVSRPVSIENEWRLIMRDCRVIAGSSYRISGRVLKTQSAPADVIQFAETVASNPFPGLPNIYVMDIGSMGDRLAVVEIGSINACGFYGCDMSVVIKAVSDEAEKVWHSSK